MLGEFPGDVSELGLCQLFDFRQRPVSFQGDEERGV
jgi:hypothetical protein